MNATILALVPLFVEYHAAHLAAQCAHMNQIRAAGGHANHVAKTAPRFDRARGALVAGFTALGSSSEERRLASKEADRILLDEQATREAGRVWDADDAIEAWRQRQAVAA